MNPKEDTPDLPSAIPALTPRAKLPADLQVPWDWVDLLLFVAITVGGAMVCSMLLSAAFEAFGVSAALLDHPSTDRVFFRICTEVLLYLILLLYLTAQMRMRSQSRFWRTIGWKPLETGPAPRALGYLGFIFGGFVLERLVTLSSDAFLPKKPLPIQAVFQGRSSTAAFMLVAVLIAPVVEETIFRGYVYPVVARSYGVLASVLFTGAVFGLLHAQQLWGGWWQIALLVMVGIIFTYARAVTGTVTSSYLLHVSYNSFQVIGFLIVSHGLHRLPMAR